MLYVYVYSPKQVEDMDVDDDSNSANTSKVKEEDVPNGKAEVIEPTDSLSNTGVKTEAAVSPANTHSNHVKREDKSHLSHTNTNVVKSEPTHVKKESKNLPNTNAAKAPINNKPPPRTHTQPSLPSSSSDSDSPTVSSEPTYTFSEVIHDDAGAPLKIVLNKLKPIAAFVPSTVAPPGQLGEEFFRNTLTADSLRDPRQAELKCMCLCNCACMYMCICSAFVSCFSITEI